MLIVDVCLVLRCWYYAILCEIKILLYATTLYYSSPLACITMTTCTQAVSAGMVTTAMSNKRKVSFFSPDPVSYAREAVATIGIQGYTHGCWSHALQVYNYNSVTAAVLVHVLILFTDL